MAKDLIAQTASIFAARPVDREHPPARPSEIRRVVDARTGGCSPDAAKPAAIAVRVVPTSSTKRGSASVVRGELASMCPRTGFLPQRGSWSWRQEMSECSLPRMSRRAPYKKLQISALGGERPDLPAKEADKPEAEAP